MFVTSRRQSKFSRLPMRNVRVTPALRAKVCGPVMELRVAFPNCPAAGAVNARAVAYEPPRGSFGTPVTSGRSEPATPVPPIGAKYTGVNGRPLPVLRLAVKVQSFSSDPFQPSISVPPAIPTPLVYSTDAVTR